MRRIKHALLACLLLSLSACQTTTLVQPYDDVLVSETQDFYKQAATLLEKGREKSPQSRPMQEDADNPGHVSHYQAGYNQLTIEANGLIIRAMVNAANVGKLGKKAQQVISQVIEERIPSVCDGDSAQLGEDFTSLTVQNFVDLKCVVSNWQNQHSNAPAKTLTSADWNRRHGALLAIVIAIQQAESAKQVNTKP